MMKWLLALFLALSLSAHAEIIMPSGGAVGGSSSGSYATQYPGGRLTLVSGTPVMVAEETAKGTIYYDCYSGNGVPVYNGGGSSVLPITSCEVSLTLDSTDHVSGSNYDVFAISNAGALLLCTGPAWTNATTRSAAIATATTGYYTNTASLTHCYNNSVDYGAVAANQATYLGSFHATANGQTGMQFAPAAASGGSGNVLALYNAYNQVLTRSIETATGSAWTNSTATWHEANNSTGNQINFFQGLATAQPFATVTNTAANTTASGGCYTGINLDSVTANPVPYAGPIAPTGTLNDNYQTSTVVASFYPVLGYHYVAAMEYVTANTCTFLGTNGTANYALVLSIMM